MKYIEELNRFHVWLASHPDMPTPARLLWFVLMHYNNGCYWKRVFSLSMARLTAATGLSPSAVKRARSVLQEVGRIRYMPRKGRLSTLYEIIPLEEERSRMVCAGHGGRANEHIIPDSTPMSMDPLNSTTMSVETQKDVSATTLDDVPTAPLDDVPEEQRNDVSTILHEEGPTVLQDEPRGELQGELQGGQRGGHIHRQDKTRLDNTKETTVKKGKPEQGKAKKIPKCCFTPPSVAMVRAYCEGRSNHIDPEEFVDFYGSKGWMVGKSKMKDWKCAVRNWERRRKEEGGYSQQAKRYARSSNSLGRGEGSQARRHTFVYRKGGTTN
ncbi:hypothetical protein [uncultured Veillonella sp.]|uniref:hypothetical protein n=1 Tax=uncultured Veillonella sp. TaxID=159268 RepID=UPI0025930333|nr:hypothetical protein [uncultured Veillonella sp.]